MNPRHQMGFEKVRWLAFLFVAHAHLGLCQFSIIPIPNHTQTNKNNTSGRTKELTPLPLPFWDDFSFSNTPGLPHDTLWQARETVWVNNGMGVNPPSQGVVTFDGLNASGNPYSVNDVLAKGVADSLVSRRIALDLVPLDERGTVFLSFYYQFRGNGEPPDPGDQLRVLFKNASGEWINVRTIENDGTFDPNVFTQILIPVSGDQYYHNNFQFSILNFGRLSGPYDTWNIDYVYLNKGRNTSDTSYPDRTITTSLTSMLKGYFSMPFDHFMEDPPSNLTPPLLSMHNLEFIPGNANQSDVQPVNYDSQDTIFIYRGKSEDIFTHQLDLATTIGSPLQPLEFRKTPIQTPPDLSNLAPSDSAVRVKLKLWINSGDNIDPSTDPLGDYNTIKYAPIDFRSNDTTQVEFMLDNYYAYDDGTAEYGAALNQPGAQLAYLFEMRTQRNDTIIALDLYFPKFGEDITQSIQLLILKDLSGDPGSFLHRETVTVQRGTQNKFWRVGLSRLVGVQNRFYIGWRQATASVLAIGLDKNTDSGSKIFFNLNGAWEQNVNLTGSLMIRPVFGESDNIFVGIPEKVLAPVSIYPNPTNGYFNVTGEVHKVQLFDLTGQEIQITIDDIHDGKHVQMQNQSPGIYIVRLQTPTGSFAHRIRVD